MGFEKERAEYFSLSIRSERTRVTLERLAEIQPRTILDVGCGHGFVTHQLAQIATLTVGFDVTNQFRVSERRDAAADSAQPSFVLADARSMPFADASFDVVHASQVLEHVHDVRRVLEEMRRVTRRHIVIDVPTLLWEARYYAFSIWSWGLANPTRVMRKFAQKLRGGSAAAAVKEMCVGDHVNKWRTKQWIRALARSGVEPVDVRVLSHRQILHIYGVKRM
jgi:ubiquinone/menaquinone biosynthesis C-methylase UbiE